MQVASAKVSDGCTKAPSDQELMARLAEGDIGALGDLYLRHGTRVSAVTARLVPELSPQEVEDLCQDAFLAVRDLAKGYEERGKLQAWLIGVAVRKARNYRRKLWIRRKLLLARVRSEDHAASTGLSATDGIVTRLDTTRALGQISQKYREVLIMSVVEGFSGEEIAEALGIKPTSVWSRLHRARRAFVRALEGPDTETGGSGKEGP